MNEISFSTRNGGYRVPEAIYRSVKELVLANRECERCHTVITPENPHVYLNICLNCFMDREGKNYEFVGPIEKSDNYNDEYFHFLNRQGYIYQTYSTGSPRDFGDVQHRDIPATLKHWEFPPIPQSFTVSGKETYGYQCVITGDIQTQKVVFLKCYHNYDRDYPDFLYLAYKGGDLIEFDKKRGNTHRIWKVAKARAEATKDENGYYHKGDQKKSSIGEEWLYDLVVEIANELHKDAPA